MNLSQEAIQKILGIEETVYMDSKEMARNLTVTFFPEQQTNSQEVMIFKRQLQKALEYLGATLLPYKDSLIQKGKQRKIKKGVAIIALGGSPVGNFPIDNVMSFTDNPIITIIDKPKEINGHPSYEEHMGIGLELIAQHMSNLIICVGQKDWCIYTLNGFASFSRSYDTFPSMILNNFIPKIVARVSPPRLSEFKIKKVKHSFLNNLRMQPYIKDLIGSGHLLAKSNLYPPMKIIRKFPFKSNFYKCIANLFLDDRTGMSYGFLARQLPLKLEKLSPFNEAKKKLGISGWEGKDFFVKDKTIYILLEINKKRFVMKVPEIWVIMSRSGSEKTKLKLKRDVVKVGLINGEMVLEIPSDIDLRKGYRPSFDTRLILSHCVANAIYGAVLHNLKRGAIFPHILEKNGMGLAHWHGNILPEFTPKGWYVYGENNLPVPCASPQAAIYAFKGKEKSIEQNLLNNIQFLGDIHVEPHHGINITWKTLKGLGYFMQSIHFNTLKNN